VDRHGTQRFERARGVERGPLRIDRREQRAAQISFMRLGRGARRVDSRITLEQRAEREVALRRPFLRGNARDHRFELDGACRSGPRIQVGARGGSG
jgi:hypothetical protein